MKYNTILFGLVFIMSTVGLLLNLFNWPWLAWLMLGASLGYFISLLDDHLKDYDG